MSLSLYILIVAFVVSNENMEPVIKSPNEIQKFFRKKEPLSLSLTTSENSLRHLHVNSYPCLVALHDPCHTLNPMSYFLPFPVSYYVQNSKEAKYQKKEYV